MKTLTFSLLTLLVATPLAFSNGVLIPKDPKLPPMAIKHQRVNIEVKDGVGTTHVEQVFKNSTDRDLEATYVFPIPREASITEFAMYMNGKRVSGELLEKDKAKKIYQDIVRRMKDPGLLEHIGGQLFKVSVYPVPRNGDQKIELSYTQALEFDAGLYKLTYPLKTNEKLCHTLEDFTVSAKIHSSVPLKNIYSPSHKIGTTRKSDHEAIVGFEQDRSALDKNFVLYYGVSKKEFGLNLLTHRHKNQDGYFMMMISPTVKQKEDKIIKKDVTFVFDTSGSMAVAKMEQARDALEYCVKKLNNGDRFNIVRFSTDVETFKDELVKVSAESRKEALEFVSDLEARGGTNIDEALQTALGMRSDKDKRPHIVVFLTDGKPTIGETETATIVKHVEKGNPCEARVFVFGVGEKVNTHLLDKISSSNGGTSSYVFPEEDIEVKVSSFADKISSPVLSNLQLAVEGIKLKQQHPEKLQDLFAGDQLTVIGRYKGDDHVAIKLSGDVNGDAREYVYEGTFPNANADNPFVAHLWATRRVGYLLDEIRLHGEEKELKDEVITLSKEFGIVTPYTSYLIVEDEVPDRPPVTVAPPPPGTPVPRPLPDVYFRSRAKSENAASESRRKTKSVAGIALNNSGKASDAVLLGTVPSAPQGATKPGLEAQAAAGGSLLKKSSGRDALLVSEALEAYKESEVTQTKRGLVSKTVEGHRFTRINGVWTDETETKALKVVQVKFGSDAYFKLLEDKPELMPFFALGEKVVVVLDRVVYKVD